MLVQSKPFEHGACFKIFIAGNQRSIDLSEDLNSYLGLVEACWVRSKSMLLRCVVGSCSVEIISTTFSPFLQRRRVYNVYCTCHLKNRLSIRGPQSAGVHVFRVSSPRRKNV